MPVPRGDPPRRIQRLTFGPLPLIAGWLPFEYERAVSQSWSLYVGPQLRPTAGLAFFAGSTAFGARLSLGARFFPIDVAPAGLWVAGEVTPEYNYVKDVNLDNRPYQERQWALSAVGMLGYSYIFDRGFTLSGGAGFGVGYSDDLTTFSDVSPVEFDRVYGIKPVFALHANLGWAF